MPTLQDIASLAGSSVQTVSAVMRGQDREKRISSRRAAAIRAIAEQVGYRPNAAARATRLRRTDMVGVLIQRAPGHLPTHNDSMSLVMGINAGLEEQDKVMCLVRLHDVLSGGDDRLNSRVFREHVLDGMVIVNAVPDALNSRLQQLVPACVWVDHNRFAETCCVRRDEYAAGRTVVTQLAARGYRRFLYVSYAVKWQEKHYSEVDRLRGVLDAAAELRLPCEQRGVPLNGPGTQPLPWLGELTRDTAVIAYDAPAARSVLLCLACSPLTVGRDLGLACCDDAADLAHVAHVQFERSRIGREAARMMAALLAPVPAEPPSLQLSGAWVEGLTAPPVNP